MSPSGDIHIAFFADERSIHTRRWVLGLRDFGYHIDLITLRKDKRHDIGGISLGAGSKAAYITKIVKLRKIIKYLNPDIIHTHYASSYGFLASFISHPRKILSVWGDDIIVFPWRNFVFKSMMRRSLTGAHKITATSEYLARALEPLGILSNSIEIIPFGVDVNRFSYMERSGRKEIRIGIAKHLEPYYGIDTLIRAFQIVINENENIRLIIAGRGKKEKEYKRLAADLRLTNYIEFLGFIEHSRMPEFLWSLDIAAMPSNSDAESFGVAALEASATGLPVVATNAGGIPEIVKHGVTGFLAAKGDAAQLAEYFMRLINDIDLRRRMGIAGRKLVEQRYRWKECLAAVDRLYLRTMES